MKTWVYSWIAFYRKISKWSWNSWFRFRMGGGDYLNSFSPRWLRREVVESDRWPSRRTRGPPQPAGSAPPAPPPSSSPGIKSTVTTGFFCLIFFTTHKDLWIENRIRQNPLVKKELFYKYNIQDSKKAHNMKLCQKLHNAYRSTGYGRFNKCK